MPILNNSASPATVSVVEAPAKQPSRKVQLTFLCAAIIAVLISAVLTPPFEVPDEPVHLFRAYQISRGRLLAQRLSTGGYGGHIDAGLIAASSPTMSFRQEILAHPASRRELILKDKFSPGIFRNLRTARWTGKLQEQAFPSSAIYPPMLYLPQAGALLVGRLCGLSMLASIYLARIVTGLIAVLLGAWAIRISGVGRTAMVVLLLLPMTIFEAASSSQDALLTTCIACTVAILSRAITERRVLTLAESAIAAVLLTCCAMAKPPYVFLSLLFLLPGNRPDYRLSPRFAWNRLRWTLLVVAATVGWVLVAAHMGGPQYENGAGPQQLASLRNHPQGAAAIVIGTLAVKWFSYLIQFIGVLGWLDTPLSLLAYGYFVVLLIVAGLIGTRKCSIGLHRRLVTFLLIILSAASIILILYVMYTPAGASVAQGVQGRYFIPLAFLVGIITNPAVVLREKAAEYYEIFLIVAATIGTIFWTTTALTHRYYVGSPWEALRVVFS